MIKFVRFMLTAEKTCTVVWTWSESRPCLVVGALGKVGKSSKRTMDEGWEPCFISFSPFPLLQPAMQRRNNEHGFTPAHHIGSLSLAYSLSILLLVTFFFPKTKSVEYRQVWVAKAGSLLPKAQNRRAQWHDHRSPSLLFSCIGKWQVVINCTPVLIYI